MYSEMFVLVCVQFGGMICEKLKHPMTGLLKLVLWALSTWFGTLILCGMGCVSTKFPFIHSYPDLSVEKRQQIMRSWSLSYIRQLRQLFRTIKLLTLLIFFTQVYIHFFNIYSFCKSLSSVSLVSAVCNKKKQAFLIPNSNIQ